jgi:hypothetical protein
VSSHVKNFKTSEQEKDSLYAPDILICFNCDLFKENYVFQIVFNSLTKIKFIYYTICSLEVHNSMLYSIFTECVHCHNFRTFALAIPTKGTLHLLAIITHSLPIPPPASGSH